MAHGFLKNRLVKLEPLTTLLIRVVDRDLLAFLHRFQVQRGENTFWNNRWCWKTPTNHTYDWSKWVNHMQEVGLKTNLWLTVNYKSIIHLETCSPLWLHHPPKPWLFHHHQRKSLHIVYKLRLYMLLSELNQKKQVPIEKKHVTLKAPPPTFIYAVYK